MGENDEIRAFENEMNALENQKKDDLAKSLMEKFSKNLPEDQSRELLENYNQELGMVLGNLEAQRRKLDEKIKERLARKRANAINRVLKDVQLSENDKKAKRIEN